MQVSASWEMEQRTVETNASYNITQIDVALGFIEQGRNRDFILSLLTDNA